MAKRMWTRRELLGAVLVLPVVARGRAGQALPEADRRHVVGYLGDTRDQWRQAVEGLTPAQWRFSPGAGVWSPLDILEHVTVVEQSVFTQVRQASTTRTAVPQAQRPRFRDQVVELVTTNRTTRRFTSPEVFRPTNKWGTPAALTDAFTRQRQAVVHLAATTAEDLRAFVWDNPIIGPCDAYHWLLFIGAHAERHLLQLNELRSHSGFPRNGK